MRRLCEIKRKPNNQVRKSTKKLFQYKFQKFLYNINRMGRQDMFRSAPFEKIEVKKEETINNEEEEDKKYFIE